jgi:glutamate-1-semialdehyde aminotransferase
MPRKYPFDTTLADSEQIERVWAENPTFSLGEITLAALQTKLKDLREKRDQAETLRTQLTALTNDLNTRTAELATINTRARSGFRAVYGTDSTQYEQAGGTRASERKRPSKKKPAPAS